jgi:4-hydroxy-tetrahydrodipicolinate reductase
MGREVCRAVEEAEDLLLAAVVDPAFDDAGRADEAGRADDAGRADEAGRADDAGRADEAGRADDAGSGGAAVVSRRLEALAEAGVEVAVDFTVASAARSTLPWLADHGIHAVVGTTGLDADDLATLAAGFKGGRANAVIAPNFAIGAVLLMRFSELAAPFMDGVEVIELHHDQKRDAPSGTALQTAARIAAAREGGGAPPLGDATADMVLEGARGGSGAGGVRVHSVRLPGLVAHQEVIFGALGQSLTLRHDSYDRRSFMPGVLLAVRRVADLPGLTVGLDALLGI